MILLAFGSLLAAMAAAGSAGVTDGPADWVAAVRLGGSFTVYSYGESPYNRAPGFLTLEERRRFSEGSNAFLETQARAGDLFRAADRNGESCGTCHYRDGRGRAHAEFFGRSGFSISSSTGKPVFRVASPDRQHLDAFDSVTWHVWDIVKLSDGIEIKLVMPVVTVSGTERHANLRNAPGVYGLGLIEAVPDHAIKEFARARSYANFGISGVAPVTTDGRVGKFGWKGQFSSLEAQVRHALAAELGIHDDANRELSPTAHERLVSVLTEYLRMLGVPARRLATGREHNRGAELFASTGCVMCHKPSWRTADGSGMHAAQLIYPFTDLLLHDMGEGLADPIPYERHRLWRTPPLWGIGTQRSVSDEAGFLHDGRARTLLEAILWHGGEAEAVIGSFKRLSTDERQQLLEYLESL